MAYIGKSPQVGNYIKLDAITTSSTNTYNLLNGGVAFVPESALHMLVSLNGVIQAPLTAFSVSGSTITFLPSSGTLSSSDSIDFILVLGNTLDIGTPSDSTVTNAKTNFVSTSSSAGLSIKGDGTTDGTLQLNCRVNSHGVKLASPPHSAGQSYTLTLPTGNVTANRILKVDSVSGSGATGIGQLSFDGGNTPSFQASLSSDTAISNTTSTKVNFDTELFDSDGTYDNSSNYRFTPAVAGKYYLYASLRINTDEDFNNYQLKILKNDSTVLFANRGHRHYGTNFIAGIVDSDTNDYFDVQIYQDSGGSVNLRGIAHETYFGGFKVIM